MKTNKVILGLALALASSAALADIDKILPASKYDVKVERGQRIAGDAHLQGQLNGLNSRADANDLRNDGQDSHINAVQGSAQAANEKADAGAVRMDGIEGSLANTDGRSINNAVRLDGVEATNAAQDTRLDKTNKRVDAVAWTTNSNTTRVGKLEGRADDTDLALINHGKQLESHGGRLDGHDQQFANQDAINAAVGSSLAGLYQDTAALNGKVAEAHAEARQARREAKEAKAYGAIALAVAGHQFNTEPSAGFQMALSASTIGGHQGYALGAGGAINERLFVNVGLATSGGERGGVVSGTYTFGR